MDTLIYILTGILTAYPALLYFLPAKYAAYISQGITLIESINDVLKHMRDTKGGLSNEPDTK